MKIVIAPDSFKESLTAAQVAAAIRSGMQRIWPDCEYIELPLADGGEGTVQALVDASGGHLQSIQTSDPLDREITADYGILGDQQTAVIEMAAASGLHHIPLALRDPKQTSSFGTGELIRHALDQGLRKIIIGLGGSATNEGGIGMLAALGVKFKDRNGVDIPLNGQGLMQLAEIDMSGLDRRLAQCEMLVACDVDNPLCGEQGASATFGRQKGATTQDIQQLDSALLHYATLIQATTGKAVAELSGAGAAGGMGAALLGFLPVQLKPGIQIIAETLNLEQKIADADLLITGEGRIDGQSIHGKTPVGVAALAKRYDIPVIAVAGSTGAGYQQVYQHGIDAVFAAVPRAMSLDEALTEAATNLSNVGENIARLWCVANR